MRYALMLLGFILVAGCQKPQTQASDEASASTAGPVKGVNRTHRGQMFPDVLFTDEEDKPMRYEPLLGQPTLVNLWATWCAPCVKELPTLEKLSKQRHAGLNVIPISQDMAPRASVEAFLEQHKLDLPIYRDPKMAVAGALAVDVLPTTILYDANGKEVWRYVGELDWTSPQAAKLLAEAAVPQKS